MNDSGKNSSSSAANSLIPKPPAASDENAESFRQKAYDSCNMKKPSPCKIPCSDGAWKATPRKVLTERNGSSDLHVKKTQNSWSKSHPMSTGRCSSNRSPSSVSKSNEKSVDPNDSWTNYLTPPRPTFLRYNPNRQRELFLHLEKKAEEVNAVLSESQDSSSNPKEITEDESDPVNSCDVARLVEEEEDYGDDEIEEERKEQRRSILLQLLKNLILLFVLSFPAYSLSKMDLAPSTSHEIWGVGDGYCGVHNLTTYDVGYFDLTRAQIDFTGMIDDIDSTSELADEQEPGNAVLEAVERTNLLDEAENDKHLAETGMVKGVVEKLGGKSSDFDQEIERPTGHFDQFSVDFHLQQKEIAADSFYQVPDASEVDVVTEPGMVEEAEVDLGGKSPDFDQKIEAPNGAFDQFIVDFHLQQREIADSLCQVPNASEVDVVTEPLTEPEAATLVHRELEEEEVNTNGECEESLLILKPEAKLNLREALDFLRESISIPRSIISLSAMLLAIFASFLSGFVLKGKSNSARNGRPPPSKRPCPVPSTEHNKQQNFPPEEEKCIEAFACTAIAPEETDKELSQSRAPTIELLGELVVGDLSSSLKSKRLRYNIAKYVADAASLSLEKSGIGAKSRHGVFNEFSRMNPPMTQSLAAERKTKEKKEGGPKESTKGIATPVRRSTRIQNRAIQSP